MARIVPKWAVWIRFRSILRVMCLSGLSLSRVKFERPRTRPSSRACVSGGRVGAPHPLDAFADGGAERDDLPQVAPRPLVPLDVHDVGRPEPRVCDEAVDTFAQEHERPLQLALAERVRLRLLLLFAPRVAQREVGLHPLSAPP